MSTEALSDLSRVNSFTARSLADLRINGALLSCAEVCLNPTRMACLAHLAQCGITKLHILKDQGKFESHAVHQITYRLQTVCPFFPQKDVPCRPPEGWALQSPEMSLLVLSLSIAVASSEITAQPRM